MLVYAHSETQNWRKNASGASYTGLISRTYKELIYHNNRKANHTIKSGKG